MIKAFTEEQTGDIEGVCSHMEGHLASLRAAVAMGDVKRAHAQATEINGWSFSVLRVCETGESD